MTEYRNSPLDNTKHEANWSQLFALTEHWKSDIKFYMLDLEFLQHIIDNYFIWMDNREDIEKVREIESVLVNTTRNCNQLQKKTAKHLKHLGHLIDDPNWYDSNTFRNEHEQLENDIAYFVKMFQKSRKEVFHITKQVLDSETLVTLLNSQTP